MELDNRIKALIAVGSSVTANCQPCLQSAALMALESGANNQEIAEAIQVGKRVRAGAASRMDNFTLDLKDAARIPEIATIESCGCRLPDNKMEEG
jgi:AhpD family alkylhydroperoxidase